MIDRETHEWLTHAFSDWPQSHHRYAVSAVFRVDHTEQVQFRGKPVELVQEQVGIEANLEDARLACRAGTEIRDRSGVARTGPVRKKMRVIPHARLTGSFRPRHQQDACADQEKMGS